MSPGKWYVFDEKICNIQPIGEFYETGTEFYSSERAMKLFLMLEVEKSLEGGKDWALKEVNAEFNDVFAMSLDELKCTELIRHVIDTNGHAAIKQLPRRTPFALRKQMDKMIDKMLERGEVQHLHSPWASPVVLLAKTDGKLRYCVDYRHLNSITKWILSHFLESMIHWIYWQTHPTSQFWILRMLG